MQKMIAFIIIFIVRKVSFSLSKLVTYFHNLARVIYALCSAGSSPKLLVYSKFWFPSLKKARMVLGSEQRYKLSAPV
jgi:hypothetical protein